MVTLGHVIMRGRQMTTSRQARDLPDRGARHAGAFGRALTRTWPITASSDGTTRIRESNTARPGDHAGTARLMTRLPEELPHRTKPSRQCGNSVYPLSLFRSCSSIQAIMSKRRGVQTHAGRPPGWPPLQEAVMERGRTASHQAVVRGVLGPSVAAQGPQAEDLRRALRAVRMPGRAPRRRSLRMLLIAPVALAVLAACGGRARHPGIAAATATAAPGSVRATPPSRRATGLRSPPSTALRLSPVARWRAGKDWTYIPTTRRVVALTFDAGANADGVASILATVRREHAPATFFLTGNFVREFPASARAIAGAGRSRRTGAPVRGRA
jgi:hypothetical protein